VTTLTLTLERPCPQAVGCRHEDATAVAERWAFCRSFFSFPLRACGCCGGPTTAGEWDYCAACEKAIIDTIQKLMEV
jgi:hypothetical protein